MTTFLRYLEVASFIVLVAALSMMSACGSEEPVNEQPPDLSSSFIEQPLDYVGSCDVLHYTFHIVNIGSPTEVRVVCNFSNHMAIHEEAVFVTGNAGDCLVDYDREDQVATITLEEGRLLTSDMTLMISADGTALVPPLGQPILTECYIYDILEEKEYKLDDTVDFHPGIEYGWDECDCNPPMPSCDCNPPMLMDECDIDCVPSSQEKTYFDEAGVPTGRSITQYECDSMGRWVTGETTDFDLEGAPTGGSITEYEYDGVGNRISEETTNFDKQGTPTGGATTEYEYDSLNRLISMEKTNLDDEATPTGSATTEFEYDPMGNLLTKETTNSGDLAEAFARTITQYEYTEEGWVAREVEDDFNSEGAETGSTVTEYEYDDDGDPILVREKKLNELDELLLEYVGEFEYNSDGYVTKGSATSFDENGKQDYRVLVEYEYGFWIGLPIYVSVSHFDENDKQIDRTVAEYEYDWDEGRETKVSVSYRDESDKQTCATSIQYEYDKDGRITKATISTYDGNNTLTHRKVLEYRYDEQGKMTEVSSQYWDPAYDLYDVGGLPATATDWQDITEIEAVCTDETLTLTLTVDGDFPGTADFRDGAIMILIDIDEDGEVELPEGSIDIYGGIFDFGVFIPSPDFEEEPEVFIEDLRLLGGGEYETEGVRFSIDGNEIKCEILSLDLVGDPQVVSFVGAIKTGIMSGPIIEDRVPNEGLAEIPDP